MENLTREEACYRFKSKVDLVARRVSDRLPRDAAVQLEDLMSWGAIGLLEAFDRFDESRGIKFSTYAEFRIRGAMYDALRTHDTFSRRRRLMARRVDQAQEACRRKQGREPTPEEVATKMEITLDEYWAVVDRVKTVSHVSLDDTDEGGRPLAEILMGNSATPGERLVVSEVRSQLRAAISTLPERERQSVLMYYGRDMSLAEIAAVYGVTVSRISQILSAARGRLHKRLAPLIQPSDLDKLEMSE
ncbi:MAG: FliA/WhiG family RNA polymerase sigma factor [Rhodobacterales bacterium]|nr:FliA/WhiG family RNA polymerase sigma factor [Rhodobacterales bacterium]